MFINSKKTVIFALVLIVALLCSLTACSNYDKKDDNKNPEQSNTNVSVKAGDTVDYAFSVADCGQKITGYHIELFFNNDVLKIKEVNTDNLTGATVNENLNNDGRITVVNSFVNGGAGKVCEEKTDIITVSFEAVKDGNADIKYYIPYMYDYDMVNIHTCTFTETINVNDDVVKDNGVPVLADDKFLAEFANFDKGDFENSVDGKITGK